MRGLRAVAEELGDLVVGESSVAVATAQEGSSVGASARDVAGLLQGVEFWDVEADDGLALPLVKLDGGSAGRRDLVSACARQSVPDPIGR